MVIVNDSDNPGEPIFTPVVWQNMSGIACPHGPDSTTSTLSINASGQLVFDDKGYLTPEERLILL